MGGWFGAAPLGRVWVDDQPKWLLKESRVHPELAKHNSKMKKCEVPLYIASKYTDTHWDGLGEGRSDGVAVARRREAEL